jgi:hypothetical protein
MMRKTMQQHPSRGKKRHLLLRFVSVDLFLYLVIEFDGIGKWVFIG